MKFKRVRKGVYVTEDKTFMLESSSWDGDTWNLYEFFGYDDNDEIIYRTSFTFALTLKSLKKYVLETYYNNLK